MVAATLAGARATLALVDTWCSRRWCMLRMAGVMAGLAGGLHPCERPALHCAGKVAGCRCMRARGLVVLVREDSLRERSPAGCTRGAGMCATIVT